MIKKRTRRVLGILCLLATLALYGCGDHPPKEPLGNLDEDPVIVDPKAEVLPTYEGLHESEVRVGSMGQLKVQVDYFEEDYGLLVLVKDVDDRLIYSMAEDEVVYGDNGVSVQGAYVEDVNGDGLEDLVVIYKSYLGAGYLGGLEYDKAMVFLRAGETFTFDQKHYDLGNQVHIDTSLDQVKHYYGSHDFDYDLEMTTFDVKNGAVAIKATYPKLLSEDATLQLRANAMIEYYIDGLFYDFNDFEDKVSVTITSEVSRHDRFLSIKFLVDWYAEGAAYPNLNLKTLNIDLKVGNTLDFDDMVLGAHENLGDLVDMAKNFSYAGMDEKTIGDELKAKIIEDWSYNNAYFDRAQMHVVIPTNHASGSFIVLDFDMDDLKAYGLIDPISYVVKAKGETVRLEVLEALASYTLPQGNIDFEEDWQVAFSHVLETFYVAYKDIGPCTFLVHDINGDGQADLLVNDGKDKQLVFTYRGGDLVYSGMTSNTLYLPLEGHGIVAYGGWGTGVGGGLIYTMDKGQLVSRQQLSYYAQEEDSEASFIIEDQEVDEEAYEAYVSSLKTKPLVLLPLDILTYKDILRSYQ